MIIYPAIDVLNGRAVRLLQGKRSEVTDYGDPVEIAKKWRDAGADWLHMVDLTGAFDGVDSQSKVIKRARDMFGRHVQLGGGIRSMSAIAERIDHWGMSRVILGSAAVTNPALITEACKKYSNKILCGIDARDGMVALHGWTEKSEVKAIDLAKQMQDAGVCGIIYTDISRDGMLTGPNISALEAMQNEISIPVIASGGIAQLQNLIDLKAIGCRGVIIGKALYEKAFTLEDALAI